MPVNAPAMSTVVPLDRLLGPVADSEQATVKTSVATMSACRMAGPTHNIGAKRGVVQG